MFVRIVPPIKYGGQKSNGYWSNEMYHFDELSLKNVYNFSLSSISSSGMEMIGYKVIFGTPYRDI
jgi:hypothetical protein